MCRPNAGWESDDVIRKRDLDEVEKIIAELGERGLLPFPITEAVARDACAEGELRPRASEEQIRTVLLRSRAQRILAELGLPCFHVRALFSPERAAQLPTDERAALVPFMTGAGTGTAALPGAQATLYLLIEPDPGGDAFVLQLAQGVAPDPLIAGDLILIGVGRRRRGSRPSLVLADDSGGLRVRRAERADRTTADSPAIGRVMGWAEAASLSRTE